MLCQLDADVVAAACSFSLIGDKWCCRNGKVLLWMCYCGVVTVGLLVPAFVVSGMVVGRVVEELVRVTEELKFDYARENPMAFLPIISCARLGLVGQSGKSEIRGFGGTRVIPFGHELQATVSLMLPELVYNRNLGLFEVCVKQNPQFYHGHGSKMRAMAALRRR
uniref:Seipin-2-like n=1 Tax=Tanacetum cinerariifolium TaxID=118510 RepID=A0A699IQL6_TANCI|nr:seipin-2-like [Tanacetum cinerariifolium]